MTKTMTKTASKYQLVAPTTPGAAPVVTTTGDLRSIRTAAREYSARRDLTHQDVRIERRDGTLVEYAGPSR